jgi:hypothetical protein
MRFTFALLLQAFALAVGATDAAEPAECVRIEDRDERLACYDGSFSRAKPLPPDDAVTGAGAAQPAANHAGVPETAPSRSPSGRDSAEARGENASSGLVRGGLFNDPEVNLTSTIVAIRNGDKQKMVFLLENDEVWMQAAPRRLPFQEGDTVTIRNATLGGYFMRSPRGTGTRVQRIR